MCIEHFWLDDGAPYDTVLHGDDLVSSSLQLAFLILFGFHTLFGILGSHGVNT